MSKEELIKKMVSVEFNRFINYYKKTRDISSMSSGNERSRDDREPREISNNGATRYFVNIGSRDNFDWMTLKDYLKETLALGRDDVFKVDVKEGFSFFNTDPEHADKVMDILNNATLEGRRINVEISKNDGGGRRDHNGRSSGGFGGQRSSGGFRGGDRNERSSGGFRSDRSSAPREGGGFRSDRNAAPREGGFQSERSAAPRENRFSGDRPTAPREGGFARKEPGAAQRVARREGTSSETPREKRPRRS